MIYKDYVIIIIIIISIIIGTKRGFLKEVIFFVNLFFSYFITNNYYYYIYIIVSDLISNNILKNTISIVIAFTFSLICITKFINYILYNLINKIDKLKINRILGFLFGFIRGICISNIFLNFIKNKQIFWKKYFLLDNYINNLF